MDSKQSEAVRKVLLYDFLKIRDGCEVHHFISLNQKFIVVIELLGLNLADIHTDTPDFFNYIADFFFHIHKNAAYPQLFPLFHRK